MSRNNEFIKCFREIREKTKFGRKTVDPRNLEDCYEMLIVSTKLSSVLYVTVFGEILIFNSIVD